MADRDLATTSQLYGPQDTANGKPRYVPGSGKVKSIMVDFDYTKLGILGSTSKPETFWGAVTPHNNVARLPAGAQIVGVSLIATTALVGNSSVLQVGLYESDGTVTDLDGLVKDLAESSIDADDDSIHYNPALASVGSVSPLMGKVAHATAETFIAMSQSAASKSFTAGVGKLIVDFVPAP